MTFFYFSNRYTGGVQKEQILFSGATYNTLEISGYSQFSFIVFQAGDLFFFSGVPLEVTHVLTNSAAGGKCNLNYPRMNSAWLGDDTKMEASLELRSADIPQIYSRLQ